VKGILALAVLLLAGCVHVAYEPGLPMPVRPVISFSRCAPGYICLTEDDANKLLKYSHQLLEFEQERSRLLKQSLKPSQP